MSSNQCILTYWNISSLHGRTLTFFADVFTLILIGLLLYYTIILYLCHPSEINFHSRYASCVYILLVAVVY